MAVAETARLIASLELKDNLSKPADRAIAKVGKLDKTLSRVGDRAGKGFAKAGENIGRLGTIAGGAVIAGLGASIKLASDLNENINKTTVVFGKASKSVLAFSEQTADSMGLSQSEALEAAGAFGNMFNTIGLADDASAKMSTRLVALASDMASFNNEDPTEMLDKLRSGLSGESEPLRRFGILISEAAVQEEAYASGLAKRGKKLTEAQKVQARYNLILKQTTVQQGDFARTSGGLANVQRRLTANLSNTAAVIGTALLPKVTDLAVKLNDLVVKNRPAIERFAAELPGAFDKAVQFAEKIPWGTIVSGLQQGAKFAGALVDAFLKMPPQVQQTIIALAGLNKLSGGAITGIVGELGKGLVKGVLSMTAASVGIKAAAVTVSGPIAGGAAGAGAAGATGVGKAGGSLKNLVVGGAKLLGAFALLDLATQGLIDEFGRFQGKVAESQAALAKQVDATSQQGVKESIDNLTATVDNLRSKDFFSQVIGSTFGGAEISKNLVDAANRLKDAKNLTADELKAARDAIEKARSFAVGNFLDSAVPPLEQALATIDKRIATEGSIYADRLDRTSGAQIAAIQDTRSEIAGVRKAVEAVNKANIAQYRKANALTEKRNKTPFAFIKEAGTTGKATGDTFAVIGNLVRAFTQGRTPWAQDLGNIKGHLANLKRLQQSLIDHGDTKGAQKIGGYIKTLQGVLAGKLDKLKPPAAPKPLVPQKPGDTGSEAVGTRLSQPITTAIDKTTTAVTTGASTAAANAAIIANRQTIATTAINTQGAATKTAITAAGATTAAAIAATKATILSGDTRSEAALTRLQGATTAVRTATATGLAGVKGAANATAAAIRNKDLSVSVTVPVNNRTIISSRGIVSSQTYIARFNQRGIK